MLRLVAFLALAILGAESIAVKPKPGSTCDVGEHDRSVSGLCPKGHDATACKAYCSKKYGAELAGAVCSAERKNKKRECICKLKCCNQGCWGDPHCWTCDGVKFGYQGLKKYVVMKPVTKFSTLPEFEIRQINKPWQKGPMAIIDISEVLIRDWKQTIVLKVPDGPKGTYILTVNGNHANIPYRFSDFDDYREHFVNIAYGDAKKTQVVLTTSFGLRIVYTTKGSGTSRCYSDISIDTPRHPELKNNTYGLLGRWNGNPADDSVDAKGQKHKLDVKFSWTFGDSWIVPTSGGNGKTPDCEKDEAEKLNDETLQAVDPKLQAQIEKICKQTLDNPKLKECAAKIGRALPSLENCVIDLIFTDDDQSRKEYIEDVSQSFFDTCERRDNAKGKNEQALAALGRADESSESDEKKPVGLAVQG